MDTSSFDPNAFDSSDGGQTPDEGGSANSGQFGDVTASPPVDLPAGVPATVYNTGDGLPQTVPDSLPNSPSVLPVNSSGQLSTAVETSLDAGAMAAEGSLIGTLFPNVQANGQATPYQTLTNPATRPILLYAGANNQSSAAPAINWPLIAGVALAAYLLLK